MKHVQFDVAPVRDLPAPSRVVKSPVGWRLGAFHLSDSGDLSGPDGLWIGGPDIALIPRRASRKSGVRHAEPDAPIANAASRGRIMGIEESAETLTLRMAWNCAEGEIQLTPCTDESLHLSWNVTLTAAFAQWQSGIMLALPRRFDHLHWERAGLDDPWPDDHPDRAAGVAQAYRMAGDDALTPNWPWALDQTAEGTNDFRSTKRNVAFGGLVDTKGFGLGVIADRPLHIRAAMAGPVVHLHLLTAADHGSESFLESFAALNDLAPGARLTGRCYLHALKPKGHSND